MNRALTGIAILLALCGFLLWWFHPQQTLKRRSKSLMNTLSLAEGAGAASRNLKLNSLSRAIADEVTVAGSGDRRADGTFRRESVEAGFTWLTRNARSSRFRIRHFDSVTISGDVGTVIASVDAEVILPENTPLDGIYSVTLSWRGHANAWRLTAAEWHPR